MTESRRKQLVFGLFLVAVIFGLFMKPWERRRPDRPVESTVQPQAEESRESVAAIMAETDERAKIRFASAWPENPFGRRDAVAPESDQAPTIVEKDDGPVPRLQGIMNVDGRKVCVIDRRTLTVGETIDGWRIATIGENEVVLTRSGRRLRLSLR